MTNKFAHIESGHKDKDGSHVCFGCCYCTNRQRRIACTCIWGPIVLLICFIIAVLIKTAFVEDKFERKTLTTDEPVFINPDLALKLEWATRLGQAIQIKTISFNETTMSLNELKLLQDFIVEKYPAIHAAEFITKTVVNEHSLIYRIEGTVHTKNPYLLCAHLDVVPEGKTDAWSHDPFLGDIVHDDETDSDYIFGRGAIDDKQSVFGILEALEHLVSQGEQPKRTFYIAFGHDEELSGHQGAVNIAVELEKFFTDNNEKLDFMLDEGMFVMKDVFPGITDPIIYVGVVEKGWAVVEISVSGVQGHASKPPRESAIGILARAIANLEENRQPSMFGKSVEIDTFEYIAPHASFLYKTIFGNLWLFSGLLSSILSGDSASDAMQRTTTAITLIDAGVKVNVIPSEAKAFINYRIHPAQSIDDVIKEATEVIDDERVLVKVVESFVPSVVTDYSLDAMPFQIVVNSALEVYPEGHVTPGIMIANTDTRHYQHLSDNTFRFSPTFLQNSDLDMFHGLNERISVDNYAQVVEFYYRLMKNADYDIKEKSDIEILAAFEGSGISEPEEESDSEVIVDQNFNEPVDHVEGSSEL